MQCVQKQINKEEKQCKPIIWSPHRYSTKVYKEITNYKEITRTFFPNSFNKKLFREEIL